MVAFDLKPSLCAVRAVSSHSSPSILWSQMMERTRAAKISAPPPGMESTPASRSLMSVSSMVSFARRARKAISTMVKALMCTLGNRSLRPRIRSRKNSKRQIGMQAADDVKLRDRFGVAGGRRLPCLFERHGVAGRVALLAAEGAQLAGRHADVGGVDVAIDVEVGHVAVHPLAHVVRQPAHGQHIA